MCKTLNLEKPKSPTQVERRLSQVNSNKKRQSKRQSISQRRKSLSKLLAYDESKDMKELDQVLLDSDEDTMPIRRRGRK